MNNRETNDREQKPTDFEPIGLVWTLVSAMTDAMNLRHLRSELYGESVDLTSPSSDSNSDSNNRITDQTTPFDNRFGHVGQRPNVEMPVQYPRVKIDIRS